MSFLMLMDRLAHNATLERVGEKWKSWRLCTSHHSFTLE